MWTEEDRRWAFALLAEEAEQCPSCRGQLDETTDPANEFGWTAKGIRCHRCAAQQREMNAHAAEGDPIGLLVVADRRQ